MFQADDGPVVLAVTDLAMFPGCTHRIWLEQGAALGSWLRPREADAFRDLLADRGLAHERRYLNELTETEGPSRTFPIPRSTPESLAAAHRDTLSALSEGAAVLYQPTLFNGTLYGRPDFLVRTAGSSRLGLFAYEVHDAKLARAPREDALIQLLAYSLLLQEAGGAADGGRAVLALGDGTRAVFPIDTGMAYVRRLKTGLQDTVARWPRKSSPEPVAACTTCPWISRCQGEWEATDHPSLVAGIRTDQIHKLADAGVHTLHELARLSSGAEIPGIGSETLARLAAQARLQETERREARQIYEILPVATGRGLARLPVPDPGDIFWDLEGDPLNADGSLEYLWGYGWWDDAGAFRFACLWAHDRSAERQAFEKFVDFIVDRRTRFPESHVYHYGAYEPSVLKRLMGRYGTREEAVDGLLRGGVLIDLYAVVREGLRISRPSYSIKEVERFFRHREGDVTNAGQSVVVYQEWQVAGDDRQLEEIRAYNEDDCYSTALLQRWLEDRRREAEAESGPIPRPTAVDAVPSARTSAEDAVREDWRRRLMAALPSDQDRWNDDERARAVLGDLQFFYRREERPAWWQYFQSREYGPEELIADPETLGGLQIEGTDPGRWSFTFNPDQECKRRAGDVVADSVTGDKVGTIVDLDPLKGRLVLEPASHPVMPAIGLIPQPWIGSAGLEGALRRLAAVVVDLPDAVAPGPFMAARALLCRAGRWPGTGDPAEASERARARAARASDRYLAIQGPPGTGKTYTGAQIVADAVARGEVVGLTGLSHAVIRNLLDAVMAELRRRKISLQAIQKVTRIDQGSGDRGVKVVTQNPPIENGLLHGQFQVVAGTAYLFARPALSEQFDLLVVDEAGQMTLATTLAAATGARSLVLLGDPQQLPQPILGAHPPGVAVSALEHVLGPRATLADHDGVFLDVSRRLHPDVGSYISAIAYEGRLASHPACARQHIGGENPLGGTGLRFVPVVHHGRQSSSPEEVETVQRLVDRLIGRPWTGQDGKTRPITLDDVLVVAPFNAHVNRLVRALPFGSRVGTVDRFQGQEAPVVIYTLACSTPEDVPHGLEFLYNLNRLNVAISRAQGLAILVASPALLDAKPRVDQIALVDALCRFAEDALRIDPRAL